MISHVLESTLSEINSLSSFLIVNVCLTCFFIHTCVFIFKEVSCRQDIVESCACIQSDNFCLLFDTFRPFIFNVIIDMVGFKSTMLLLVFLLFHVLFDLMSSFSVAFLD